MGRDRGKLQSQEILRTLFYHIQDTVTGELGAARSQKRPSKIDKAAAMITG